MIKETLNINRAIASLDIERDRIFALIQKMDTEHCWKGLEKLQIKKFKCDIIINYLAKMGKWNE
jgi:hypothetical protein